MPTLTPVHVPTAVLRNEVINPSLEVDAAGWVGTSVVLARNLVDAAPDGGTVSMQATMTAETGASIYPNASAGHYIPAAPGDLFYVRGWVKRVTDSTGVTRVYLRGSMRDAAQGSLGTISAYPQTSHPLNQWHEQQFLMYGGPGVAFFRPLFSMSSVSPANAIARVDNCLVVKNPPLGQSAYFTDTFTNLNNWWLNDKSALPATVTTTSGEVRFTNTVAVVLREKTTADRRNGRITMKFRTGTDLAGSATSIAFRGTADNTFLRANVNSTTMGLSKMVNGVHTAMTTNNYTLLANTEYTLQVTFYETCVAAQLWQGNIGTGTAAQVASTTLVNETPAAGAAAYAYDHDFHGWHGIRFDPPNSGATGWGVLDYTFERIDPPLPYYYFDGDSDFADWDGTPHASTSTLYDNRYATQDGKGIELELDGPGPYEVTEAQAQLARAAWVHAGIMAES